MRRIALIIGLELYALACAWFRELLGVHTDEAKYLLDIPYPHPPLVRSIIHATEALPFQELFWRIIIATMLIQAVWFIVDAAATLPKWQKVGLSVLWLTSTSVFLGAGTIMMAPITAVQGLVFVWLLVRDFNFKNQGSRLAGWIALLWLASLFTAYQAILYLPIVIAVFLRLQIDPWKRILAIGTPMFLVALYTVGNPLALASFSAAGAQNAGSPLTGTASLVLGAWLFSGSAILSMVGTAGMLQKKSIPLISSLVLTLVFLFLSYRSYYDVLFLPLFVGGVMVSPFFMSRVAVLASVQTALVAFVLFGLRGIELKPTLAREVVREIHSHISGTGGILINGSFGHEWQYESRAEILRFQPHLLPKADAVVCLEACPDLRAGFERVREEPGVWIRK